VFYSIFKNAGAYLQSCAHFHKSAFLSFLIQQHVEFFCPCYVKLYGIAKRIGLVFLDSRQKFLVFPDFVEEQFLVSVLKLSYLHH